MESPHKFTSKSEVGLKSRGYQFAIGSVQERSLTSQP